jgi:hypothetical protein
MITCYLHAQYERTLGTAAAGGVAAAASTARAAAARPAGIRTSNREVPGIHAARRSFNQPLYKSKPQFVLQKSRIYIYMNTSAHSVSNDVCVCLSHRDTATVSLPRSPPNKPTHSCYKCITHV